MYICQRWTLLYTRGSLERRCCTFTEEVYWLYWQLQGLGTSNCVYLDLLISSHCLIFSPVAKMLVGYIFYGIGPMSFEGLLAS